MMPRRVPGPLSRRWHVFLHVPSRGPYCGESTRDTGGVTYSQMQTATVVMAIVELNKASFSKGFPEYDTYSWSRMREMSCIRTECPPILRFGAFIITIFSGISPPGMGLSLLFCALCQCMCCLETLPSVLCYQRSSYKILTQVLQQGTIYKL